MITKRTLEKWRKDALNEKIYVDNLGRTQDGRHWYELSKINSTNDRIIRMTQELIDQHLLRK